MSDVSVEIEALHLIYDLDDPIQKEDYLKRKQMILIANNL